MPNIGIGASDGSGSHIEILASSEFELRSITVDTSCRDTGNTTTTNLRRGLLLAPDSAVANRFIPADHNDASINDDQAVVLAEDVYDIDDGHQVVKAFWKCTLKNGRLIDPNTSFGNAAYAIPASRILIDELSG